MLLPQTAQSGYDDEFPLVLRPNTAGMRIPNPRKVASEADLHVSTDTVVGHKPARGYLGTGRPRSLMPGEKGSLKALKGSQRPPYLRPIEERPSDFKPYFHGFRIPSAFIQPSEQLSSILAPYETEAQTRSLKENTNSQDSKDGPATGLAASTAEPDRKPEIAKTMSVRKVTSSEILVRSFSKALPLGYNTHTTEAVASPAFPTNPAKKPFDWQRWIDDHWEDPAEAHSRRYRERRKETYVRREAEQLNLLAQRSANCQRLPPLPPTRRN